MTKLVVLFLVSLASALVVTPPRASRLAPLRSTVAEKEEVGEEVVLSPAEDEAQMTKTIDGKPSVGVFGFFDDASRPDQFVLDVLHAQKTWGEIVVFAEDPAAAKKQLMSRSARYSGLLDVLSFEAVADAATMVGKCGAFLAFGVEPSKVESFLQAGASSDCERVVVSSLGAATTSSSYGNLDWTVVSFGETLAENVAEGGPIAVDDEDPVTDGAVSRQDAYRIVAESFLMSPVTNKAVTVTPGNDYALKYLRILREQGYTRRGELAKIASGGLKAFQEAEIAAEEAAKADTVLADEKSEEERAAEMQRLMEEARIEEKEKRDKEIAAAARDYLGRQWTEKKYSSARGLTKEEYIEIEWKVGLKEAAAILGYTTKDRARGLAGLDDDDDDDDDED